MMPPAHDIRYLPHREIDKVKWDACIRQSSNGLIYAYATYLDLMAENWDALVLNDYEMVMPLTWKKKWSIHYLYQPLLTAQLGVFGKEITAEWLQSFLYKIPAKFRYWDFALNYKNLLQPVHFPLYTRVNYVLPLHCKYEILQEKFRENIRRNVRKAEKYGCRFVKGIDVQDIIELAKSQMRQYATQQDRAFEHFASLFNRMKEKQMAETYGIVSNAGELLASCCILFSHGRCYYILVGNHPNGKTLGASHMLIDHFIREHAGQELVLDFEGSDLPKLAFFYSSFGAIQENYAAIRLNRLPFFIRWLKK